MSNVIKYPCADDLTDENTWHFPDGSSVTVKSGEGKPLTVSLAVYLLSDVQFTIHKMMRED